MPRGVDICPECKAEFEPEDDEGYRPWEQEGLERRDSEPHRGGMLLAAGIGSLITPVFFFVCYLGILTSLLGLVVSVVVIWFSTVDLRKMANHVMNKEGAGTTSGARVCAIIGAGLNVLALIAAIALTALMP